MAECKDKNAGYKKKNQHNLLDGEEKLVDDK